MRIKLTQTSAERRGTVAVVTTISLTLLLMILAITLDGGLLYAEKRHAQATADAAALAGAADLFTNYPKNAGVDKSGTASANALTIAASNGYSNDGKTSTVVVRSFGQTYLSGPNAGAAIPAGNIEVNVTYNQPRYFSLIMGSGTIPIKARAVATGAWRIPKFGVLALEPTGSGLRLTDPNVTLTVKPGNVIVDSTSGSAVTNNGTITADSLNITGGITGSGAINGTVQTGVPATPDPLAGLPVPAEPPAGKVTNLNGNAKTAMLTSLVNAGIISQAQVNSGMWKNVYQVTPGSFNNMKQFTSTDLVVFEQASAGNGGIYYLTASGFTSTGAGLVMDPSTSGGMMFYNNGTGTNDAIKITGSSGSVVNLAGIASGTYQGMIIFQNRLATEGVSVTGNGSFNMNGAFYAANADLALKGNGAGNTISSALVSRTITLTGNGTININYSGGLVAPLRIFHLTE